jgi:lipopolysaccharide transport system permease protein
MTRFSRNVAGESATVAETLDEENLSAPALVAGEHRREHAAPRSTDTPAARPRMRIEPGSAWSVRIGDLWEFRGIFYFLVWRDLKVRYRQTVFGAVWAVLQPLSLMLVFALFAGRFLHAPSQGVPYYLFAYAALVPWTLLSQALTNSSESLIRDKNLVSKVFFPRVLLPAASAVSFVFDYLVAAALLIVMAAFSDVHPDVGALFWFPVLSLMLFALAVAVAVWLSALNVMYRDVRYAVPLIAQVWLFASPIAYPITAVPEAWRNVYALNPMVGIVTSFRDAALGIGDPASSYLGISALVTAGLLVSGMLYFRRVDRLFADVI